MGTPSILEGEFLFSLMNSSPKLGEVARSDGGVCKLFHLKVLLCTVLTIR